VRDGQHERVRLRGWLDGYDGPVPTYRIALVMPSGNYTCPYTATGPDMFEALVRLRRQLEPDGLMIAVQAGGMVPFGEWGGNDQQSDRTLSACEACRRLSAHSASRGTAFSAGQSLPL
jgi:hypothetical protein